MSKLENILKLVPVTLVSWAFVAAMAIITVFSGLAIYAWFTQQTMTLAGYEFGRPSIGEGAVIAYDREAGCPTGWVPFEKGKARVIVGAGEKFMPGFDKGSDGNFLTKRGHLEYGGAEHHTLMVDEITEHEHEYAEKTNGFLMHTIPGTNLPGGSLLLAISTNGEGRNSLIVEKSGGIVGRDGPAKPHNNMPPYIALYFCKKEG